MQGKGIQILAVCVFLLLGYIVPASAQQERLSPEEIDTVIVRGVSAGRGASGKPDGAIVYTSREDILRNTSLFFDNPRTVYHACGYNYDIEFWSGVHLYMVAPYNIECGEEYRRDTGKIAALLEDYDTQFIAGTVDTIHYIQVPVVQAPQDIIALMGKDGLHVFPANGLNDRYPSIEITYTEHGKGSDTRQLEQKAIEELSTFLTQWPAHLQKPIEFTPPKFSQSCSGIDSSVLVRARVWFPLGADLEKIAAAIGHEPLQVQDMYAPEYYPLVLIHPHADKQAITELLSRYPGISLWRYVN